MAFLHGQISNGYCSKLKERTESLNAIDLLALSAFAKSIHWYESSALFATHSMRIFIDDSPKNQTLYPIDVRCLITNFTSNAMERKFKLVSNIKNPGDMFFPFSNRATSEFNLKYI